MADSPSLVADRVRSGAERGWLFGLWICLFIGFSPVLFDLAEHLREHAWARTIVVFPWLVWVASRRQMGVDMAEPMLNARRIVWLALSLGISIELLAIAGGAVRIGRIGLLLAIVGLCRGFHRAQWPAIMLLLWAVPVPSSLIGRLPHTGLQSLPGLTTAALIPGLGFEMLDRVPTWTTTGASVALAAPEYAFSMIVAWVGLGWFRAIAVGGDLHREIMATLPWAMLGLPLQFGLVLLCALVFRWTHDADLTRILLDQSGWILILALGFALSLGALGAKVPPRSLGLAK